MASAVTGSASITATDTPTSQAGTTYPITATLGTLAAKNYTFAFAPGTLTITQATTSSYTITWKSQSAVYGTALGSPPSPPPAPSPVASPTAPPVSSRSAPPSRSSPPSPPPTPPTTPASPPPPTSPSPPPC
ncbi:MBG domain-containing protein [Tunturiibacter empetritectus]|uniref:MBG domain-containing protein n=1 Tax=Tunturiibacter empetritectus TaxID=3069691 RepID=UPI003D9BC361